MTDNLTPKQLFNEHGDDAPTAREMVGGSATGIMNLNNIKYQWTSKLFKIMVNNFWLPEKVSLVEDRVTIKALTTDELEAFKNTLSFLIALDSLQVSNLPKLADYITAPEVSGLFTVQAYQELIHSQSYQYLLQELFPNMEREEIYNYWRNNPLLLKRNKFIAQQYQDFADTPNLETFKRAVAANYALEGIYFYNGFQFFYQLAARNKVANVAKMIKYIENDEVCLTADHDVLTPSGWKRINDISVDDSVCQYDTATGTMNFVNPTATIKKTTHKLVKFTGGIEQTVTPNHRMIIKVDDKIVDCNAEDIHTIKESFQYVLSGKKTGTLKTLTDEHRDKTGDILWVKNIIDDIDSEWASAFLDIVPACSDYTVDELGVIELLEYFASGESYVDSDKVTVKEVECEETDVFCITTPGTAFITRKKSGNDVDKISVTGNCHVSMFSYIIKELFDMNNPDDRKMLTDTLTEASEQEIEWGVSIYGDRILGISTQSTEHYVKYLCNQRAKIIGLGVIYKGFSKNPYHYLGGSARENFFETKTTEYSQSTAIGGWDDF